MKKISVIIPAYNEEARITPTLFDIHNTLSDQAFEYEILVVNDGSKDKTREVVRALEGKIAHLRLIDNTQNHGKGWVTRQGMLQASGDIRLFMDADNSTKVKELFAMLPLFEQGYDVVVGSRHIAGSVIAAKQPRIREILGSIFRYIVHTLLPVGTVDLLCGFKVFTAESAEVIFSKQTIFHWAFDVELLLLARKYNFKIKEMPITWHDDAQSHVTFPAMVRLLGDIVRIRYNLWKNI